MEEFFKKYKLKHRVAFGGMAEIYRAEITGAQGFAKEIAVKKIRPELLEDDEFVRMFVDEATIAAKLKHPNIVQIFDFDRGADSFYIAMEFIDGTDLSKLIKTFKLKSKIIPFNVSLFIIIEILEALKYAHELRDERDQPLNIIHRDISPANVLLSYEGEVKLGDFGIAKAAVSLVQTTAGVLKGKYPYMSPEQARNKTIDQRTDLFALGIIMYQLFTGKMPFFSKDTAELLKKVINCEYVMPRVINPNIPDSIENIILKAMKMNTYERYQTAADFLVDIRKVTYSLFQPPTRDDLKQLLLENIPPTPPNLCEDLKSISDKKTTMEQSKEFPDFDAKKSSSHKNDEKIESVEPVEPIDKTEKTTKPPDMKLKDQIINSKNIIISISILLIVIFGGISSWIFIKKYIHNNNTISNNTKNSNTKQIKININQFYKVLWRISPEEEELFKQLVGQKNIKENVKFISKSYNEYTDAEKILNSDDIDLAYLPLELTFVSAEKELVQPIDRLYFDRDRDNDVVYLRKQLSQLGLKIATPALPVQGKIYFVPGKIEVHALAYRKSKVEDAAKNWKKLEDKISKSLKSINGIGLPANYKLEKDPTMWDDFDIFVMGYYWAHNLEDKTAKPRIGIRSYFYWPTVVEIYDWILRLGGETIQEDTPQLEDIFTWLALMRETDILDRRTWTREGGFTGTNITESLASGDIYIGRINHINLYFLKKGLEETNNSELLNDIEFIPLPQGASPFLSKEKVSIRGQKNEGSITAWLWGISKKSANVETSLNILKDIVSPEFHAKMVNKYCYISPLAEDIPIDDPLCKHFVDVTKQRLNYPLKTAPIVYSSETIDELVNKLKRIWIDLLIEKRYLNSKGKIDVELIKKNVSDIF